LLQLECCGKDSYGDYIWDNKKIPLSCCEGNVTVCEPVEAEERPGCKQALIQYFKPYIYTEFAAKILFIISKFFAIILCILLEVQLRYRKKEADIAKALAASESSAEGEPGSETDPDSASESGSKSDPADYVYSPKNRRKESQRNKRKSKRLKKFLKQQKKLEKKQLKEEAKENRKAKKKKKEEPTEEEEPPPPPPRPWYHILKCW